MKAGCLPDITRPPVTVSVVCFNRLDLTVKCLAHLCQHTTAFRLIVTDNASTDGTGDYLAKWASGKSFVTVIYNSENLGYKDPHNRAFESIVKHPTSFFCALNNDVIISGPWWEQVEQVFAQQPRLAIVGARGGVCSRIGNDFHGNLAKPGEQPEYVQGSLLVIRTSVAQRLGLFATELKFAYGEDSDLSLRVREAGYSIALVDLPVHHMGSQTVRIIDSATRTMLSKAQQVNHAWLRKRWAVYLRRRDFNYQVRIRRQGALGDVILATPAIAALHQKWPDAKIYVETDVPEVFLGSPYAQSSRAYPTTKKFDYEFNFDRCYELRPLVHPVTCYAEGLGVQCPLDLAKPILFPQTVHVAAAERLLPRKAVERWALVHPGPTGWPGRDWPYERWLELTARLSKAGWKVAIVGRGDMTFDRDMLDLQGKTDLLTLAALCKSASIFVGLDSGPFHVAQAMGLPAVALFGTILPHLRILPKCRVIPVQADPKQVPCVGEHHRLRAPVTFSRCHGDCMRAISVSMVMEAVGNV